MAYLPTRTGRSREIAFAFHILGQRASAIAAQFDCSTQYVVKVLARFAIAHDRATTVRRHLARHGVTAPVYAPAPAVSKKVAAKTQRAPAKKAAKKVAAKKKAVAR